METKVQAGVEMDTESPADVHVAHEPVVREPVAGRPVAARRAPSNRPVQGHMARQPRPKKQPVSATGSWGTALQAIVLILCIVASTPIPAFMKSPNTTTTIYTSNNKYIIQNVCVGWYSTEACGFYSADSPRFLFRCQKHYTLLQVASSFTLISTVLSFVAFILGICVARRVAWNLWSWLIGLLIFVCTLISWASALGMWNYNCVNATWSSDGIPAIYFDEWPLLLPANRSTLSEDGFNVGPAPALMMAACCLEIAVIILFACVD